MKCVRLVHILGFIILALAKLDGSSAVSVEDHERKRLGMRIERLIEKNSPQNAGNGEIDDSSRALFRQAYVAAKEAGFQMRADNIAATHPFVREEPCET